MNTTPDDQPVIVTEEELARFEANRAPVGSAHWVWMTEAHAAAVWIAYHRLAASAERNLADPEGHGAEGDDDWRDLLENLYQAWENATDNDLIERSAAQRATHEDLIRQHERKKPS